MTPLPISTMAWATILASTWRGLAPSAIRKPISRVRYDTLIDISDAPERGERLASRLVGGEPLARISRSVSIST